MTLSIAVRHRVGGFDLDIAFDAPPGVTVLLGRSGAGKTTVVNAVAGLLRPDGGRIAVGDQVLFDAAHKIWSPPHRRRIGYVFQEGRLFPHLTVRQNLLYGRWAAALGWPRARAAAPAAEPTSGPGAEFDHVVEMLGIAALLTRRPGALSGGEKQRVAIGRALLSRPRLILADEPLASLDAPRKAEILPFFERLRDELSIPILYVTHSVPEAARLASTIAVLRSGRLAAVGPADAVFADPAVAPELGLREAGAVLRGRVADRGADGLAEVALTGGSLIVPDPGLPLGATARLRIEAQDVMLALRRPEAISALNVLAGEIIALRPGQGPGMLVVLAIGPDRLLARITRRSADALGLVAGQRVYAVIKSVSVAQTDVGHGPV